MRPINNYNEIQASDGEFAKPTAGGYCIEIIGVKDVPLDPITGKGDYLKIEYDICHGDFAGYYSKQHERFGGDWFASFIKSYKEKALGMFKHFTNCVEESNAGYKWNWDERSLAHKYVGVTLQEEEYRKNDGSIGVKLVVKDIKTTEQIMKGEFKVPHIKKLAENNAPTYNAYATPKFEDVTDDDTLPF